MPLSGARLTQLSKGVFVFIVYDEIISVRWIMDMLEGILCLFIKNDGTIASNDIRILILIIIIVTFCSNISI